MPGLPWEAERVDFTIKIKHEMKAVDLLFAGSESLTIINKIANVIDAPGLENE